LKDLPSASHPDLLVGRETSDDAGVYRVRDDLALIQTVDFFTPIVNDPWEFGRIAAANALSDIYAMGGRPLTAMNIVCFPKGQIPMEVLKEILLGGIEVIHEASALLIGGHSVDDPELKYGLSVTGTIHPRDVVTNAGARPGDRLILTKPLGTGILATAIKGRMITTEAEKEAIRWMTTLNRDASEAMQAVGVNACTDITGFGLLGHALEMAVASGVEIQFWTSRVPVLSSALEMARMGMIPAGSFANRNFCERAMTVEEAVDPLFVDCLADAQTSGGLLISVPEEHEEALHSAFEEKGVPHPEVGQVTDHAQGRIRLFP
jgi:selenide,water dikinase